MGLPYQYLNFICGHAHAHLFVTTTNSSFKVILRYVIPGWLLFLIGYLYLSDIWPRLVVNRTDTTKFMCHDEMAIPMV